MLEFVLIVLVVAGLIAFRAWEGGSLSDEFERQDADQRVPLPDPRVRTESAAERVGFGTIRAADPHFDLERFYERVSEMFLAYHGAIARGDLKAARRFIDERYYAALIETNAGLPVSPHDGLRVVSARAMTATHEAGMDTVRVLISAAQGQAETPSLREYWTLVRRQGALTKADLSLYKCPNCGAPTDGDDPTRCGYCGARLADPALDWVVSQIRPD